MNVEGVNTMHESQEGRDVLNGITKHKHHIPFQCIVSLPLGFQIEKPNDLKLVYDVSHLSMTKDTCKKRIEIDECGQVEIDLQVLKIKGILSLSVIFLLNLFFVKTCIQQWIEIHLFP